MSLHIAGGRVNTFKVSSAARQGKSGPCAPRTDRAASSPWRAQSGSPTPHTKKVGKVTLDQVREIAKTKQEDLNANDIDQAAKIIAGTARSMGITVEG